MPWVPWVIEAAVALATAGMVVLGVLGIRVYRDVTRLSRELDAGVRRVAAAAGALERASEPMARRAGETVRR